MSAPPFKRFRMVPTTEDDDDNLDSLIPNADSDEKTKQRKKVKEIKGYNSDLYGQARYENQIDTILHNSKLNAESKLRLIRSLTAPKKQETPIIINAPQPPPPAQPPPPPPPALQQVDAAQQFIVIPRMLAEQMAQAVQGTMGQQYPIRFQQKEQAVELPNIEELLVNFHEGKKEKGREYYEFIEKQASDIITSHPNFADIFHYIFHPKKTSHIPDGTGDVVSDLHKIDPSISKLIPNKAFDLFITNPQLSKHQTRKSGLIPSGSSSSTSIISMTGKGRKNAPRPIIGYAKLPKISATKSYLKSLNLYKI